MSYRNKTYIIFDGDEDIWAYGYMCGWKKSENVDFDFQDAHDLKPLTNEASEETVKKRLRERFSTAKQVIVLVGEKTKNLYRFVRWEIDVAIELGLPIVVVNLNGRRKIDTELCPPILREHPAMHVIFKMKIIKHALDDFCENFYQKYADGSGPYHYPDQAYTNLGL